jgi:2-methylcitrate dehydratase PrpD
MTSTIEIKPIEAMSANILDTRFEKFDQATVENARCRVIDVLGCAIAGVKADGNTGLVELVRDWGGKQEATILGHGIKVPVHNAAMVNSILARSFDFEALVPQINGADIPAHISGTTVMTAMTLGEMKEITGKELIAALLAGEDMAIRVLAAEDWWFDGGWDNTGTVNMIGATAIAGRLFGLNARQMRHAFGIVLSQIAGSFQNIWDGCTAFKLMQGLSARNGIFSAQLAKAGWTGPEDMLLSRFGFYRLYTKGCSKPEILTKDLGKTYYTESQFKPYPSCRCTHPVIDCAIALVNKHNIKTEDIEKVTVYLVQRHLQDVFTAQSFRIGEFPHGDAAFNNTYTVANALVRGSSKPEHFSEEAIHDPRVNELIGKVSLAEMPGTEVLSSRVEVTMKNGRVFSEFSDSPKGDPVRNPMSKDEIKDKFRSNIEFSKTVSPDNGEKILKLLENLEELDNVNRIIKLLVV